METSDSPESRNSPPAAVPVLRGDRIPVTRSQVREALANLGIRPSRRLGQSFLCDPFVADAEVALLESAPGRPVTEVGGGLGLLTQALLRRGVGPVRVIEKDRRLARHLRESFGPRIAVEEADALRADFQPDEPVIGNLPFSVASRLLARWFALRLPTVVALVQREVGERLVAPPGSAAYGRPTIQAALYGEVERFAPVPPTAFEPVPAVGGLIVRFRGRPGALPVPSVPLLEELVRRSFSQRRKKLGRLLDRITGSERDANRNAAGAGWRSGWRDLRPAEISPTEWFAFARELHAARGPESQDLDPGG